MRDGPGGLVEAGGFGGIKLLVGRRMTALCPEAETPDILSPVSCTIMNARLKNDEGFSSSASVLPWPVDVRGRSAMNSNPALMFGPHTVDTLKVDAAWLAA